MTKHLLRISLVVLLGVAGYRVVLYTPTAHAAESPTTEPSTQPVNKFCAVETDDPIDPAVTVQYKGKTIGFCCTSCVKKFLADPEKYMKSLK